MKNKKLEAFSGMIIPMDVLFFRDMTRFEKKRSNEVPTMITPYPSTLYGSLFSCFLREGLFETALDSIRNKKTPPMYRYLQIEKSGLFSHGTFWIPAPIDLFYNSKAIKKAEYKKIEINAKEWLYRPLTPKDDIYDTYTRASQMYLSEQGFKQYCNNEKIDGENLVSWERIFCIEEKIGIEIEQNNRQAKDNHLYRIEQVVFRDSQARYVMSGRMEYLPQKNNRVLQLGGERKMAYIYWQKQAHPVFEQPMLQTTGSYVKLILTTPMTYAVHEALREKLCIDNIEVCGGASERPKHMGSYSMAENKANNLQKILAPGSILILKNTGDNKNSTKEWTEKLTAIVNQLEGTYKGYNQFLITPFEGGEEYV